MVDVEGEQRLYPYSILVFHEMANDSINGADILVTYCPLCGTAMVFDREVGGEVLQFGVTAHLRVKLFNTVQLLNNSIYDDKDCSGGVLVRKQ